LQAVEIEQAGGIYSRTVTIGKYFGRRFAIENVMQRVTVIPEDLVRKRVESLSFIAIVAIVFAVVSCGSALQAQSDTPQSSSPQSQQQPQQPPDAQAPTPQQPDSQQAPPSQGQASQDQASQGQTGKSATSDPGGSSEFIGTVVKQGDKYMFQDAASGQTYDIDHQDEVKKFEGKKVRVHGTLDPTAKMIHVQ
jgi:hypothetical protein